jgi:prophage antirepressor-like protein
VNGQTYFVGSDVAKALGYQRPNDAITAHCRYTVKHRISDNQGVPHDYLVIPEGDLYRLAAKSELPGAENFESWIFDEVLPAIHRTGGYMVSGKDETEDELMARALLVAQDTINRHRAQLKLANRTIAEQAPKAEYFDHVLQSGSLIATNVIAKELGMSAVTLNRKLHEKGVIYKCNGTWVLYEKYQDKGYTDTKTHTWEDSHGNGKTHILTCWTEKGRMFLHSLFKRNGKVA